MRLSIGELEAESAAEAVIAADKLAALPICPFTVARKRGIEVAPKSSSKPGVSGYLMRVGNQFGIQYATHIKNDGFIRFTVAHELGHYFIPEHPEKLFPAGSGLHESRSGFVSKDPCEREADLFAATLLMPETLFCDALRTAGEGFEAIGTLSSTCRTSITSTAIRYARFAEDPVVIVVSSGASIDYCFCSDAVEALPKVRGVRKGTTLPPGSETHRFNKSKANVSEAHQAAGYTFLDEWLDGAPHVELKEDVVGLGSYGRTLTILFSSEAIDEAENEDFDDDDADD